MELRFMIPGQAMSKKRSWFIVRTAADYPTPHIAMTNAYKGWEEAAVQCLLLQRVGADVDWPIREPIHLKCVAHMKNERAQIDMTDIIQSFEDALQRARIIVDGSIVRSLDGSRLHTGVPDGQERAELTLTLMADEEAGGTGAREEKKQRSEP